MGKKKKDVATKAITSKISRTTKRLEAAERREQKLRRRAEKERLLKKDKNMKHSKITAEMWEQPPPAHLVAKLEVPKVTTKYQSYYEFAENTEKKKKLETMVCSCLC